MTQVRINDDVFTLKKFKPVNNGKTNLYDLYKTASDEKQKAFNYWKGKLVEITWLVGNCNMFTIYGAIVRWWFLHNVKITKCNNYIM